MKPAQATTIDLVKKTLSTILLVLGTLLSLGALYTLVVSDNLYIKAILITAVGVMLALFMCQQTADDVSLT